MNAPARSALGLLLLSAVGGLFLTLSRPGPSSADAAPPRFTSSTECRACHEELFDEWDASHHRLAYENPEVRRLSDDFRNKECQACHLPRPIAETGLLNRTLPRFTRPSEGVDCLTCHLDGSGRIAGLRASDQGCAPVANADLLSVRGCETCHNQHKTTDQWRASSYARDGITCNACHMPQVTRADGSLGRKHVFEGCHELDMLRSAATFRARREAGEVVVETTNSGAGHNFPTEERHRAVDVLVRFVDAAGQASAWERVWRFRQPYRDEPGENTQLPAGETHVDRLTPPPDAVRAELRLWYRLNPYATDEDEASTLLFETEVALE